MLTEPHYRVADCAVFPDSLRLEKNGKIIKLEPKVMQLLDLFARHRGEVLSRHELEASVWAGRVVGYDAVTNTIIKLRRAFGDNSRKPNVIETIPKKGYRLIAEVRFNTGESNNTHPELNSLDEPAGTGNGFIKTNGLIVANDAQDPQQGSQLKSFRQGNSKSSVVLLVLFTSIVFILLGLVAYRFGLMSQQSFIDKVVPDETDTIISPMNQTFPTIALLPLKNLNKSGSDQYFVDGFSDDLITAMSKLPRLQVIASASVYAYSDDGLTHARIGDELGVSHLLMGSLQKNRQMLRLNVHLMDIRTNQTIWAEKYDRKIQDLFALQDELTNHIVAALKLRLSPSEHAKRQKTPVVHLDAYDAFLQGQDYLGRHSIEDNQRAKELFYEAIRLDSGFSRAYAALALAYSRDYVFGWEIPDKVSLMKAAELVDLAELRDNAIPQVYFVKSFNQLHQGAYESATQFARKAVTIDPNYADGFALQAWIQFHAGDYTKGLKLMNRAAQLNPRLSAIYFLVRGSLHYALNELESAKVNLEHSLERNPQYQMPRLLLAATESARGNQDAATWHIDELLTVNSAYRQLHVKQTFPIRNAGLSGRLLDDLNRAGLPE